MKLPVFNLSVEAIKKQKKEMFMSHYVIIIS